MTTIVEKHNALKRSSVVSIRPYVDPSVDNMGLQNYGMALFEGIVHEEQLACLELNGIKRYVTGLNEFAPEIKMIKDPEEKEAKIKEIRTIVSQLEKDLAANIVDINDPEFWNKIKLLRHDNSEFWDKITLRVGNEPKFLDPTADPYDLILLKAIEAGGFSMIAKSFDDARSSSKNIKFYLDKYEDTAAVKTEVKKLRNKALSELQSLFDTNQNKLFLVCKVVDPMSHEYQKSTPADIMYDNMDKYINGETVEFDKRKTAQRFLDVASLDAETLKLRALVKDATFYKLISVRPDGGIYHMKTSSLLGKSPADVVEYLKNPLNEDILAEIMSTVESYWK